MPSVATPLDRLADHGHEAEPGRERAARRRPGSAGCRGSPRRAAVRPLLGQRGGDRAAHRVADDDRARQPQAVDHRLHALAPGPASSSPRAASPSRRARAGRCGSRGGRGRAPAPSGPTSASSTRSSAAARLAARTAGPSSRTWTSPPGRSMIRPRSALAALVSRSVDDRVDDQEHGEDDAARREDCQDAAHARNLLDQPLPSPGNARRRPRSSTPAALAMNDTRW